MAHLRKAVSLLALTAALAGCGLVPVTPWVKYTAYSTPIVDHQEFEDAFTAWKSGQSVSWTLRFKGSDFADQVLTIASSGTCSLGAALPTANTTSKTFKVSTSELQSLATQLIATGVFTLYDGHYGAYLQGGGQGGPDLDVTIGGLEKHVSKDDSLSAGVSREADIINKASNAVADLALKYVK